MGLFDVLDVLDVPYVPDVKPDTNWAWHSLTMPM